jgi:hypothetical protein
MFVKKHRQTYISVISPQWFTGSKMTEFIEEIAPRLKDILKQLAQEVPSENKLITNILDQKYHLNQKQYLQNILNAYHFFCCFDLENTDFSIQLDIKKTPNFPKSKAQFVDLLAEITESSCAILGTIEGDTIRTHTEIVGLDEKLNGKVFTYNNVIEILEPFFLLHKAFGDPYEANGSYQEFLETSALLANTNQSRIKRKLKEEICFQAMHYLRPDETANLEGLLKTISETAGEMEFINLEKANEHYKFLIELSENFPAKHRTYLFYKHVAEAYQDLAKNSITEYQEELTKETAELYFKAIENFEKAAQLWLKDWNRNIRSNQTQNAEHIENVKSQLNDDLDEYGICMLNIADTYKHLINGLNNLNTLDYFIKGKKAGELALRYAKNENSLIIWGDLHYAILNKLENPIMREEARKQALSAYKKANKDIQSSDISELISDLESDQGSETSFL